MLIQPSQWIIILSSVVMLIWPHQRFKCAALLAIGYGLMGWHQQITLWTLLPIGLLLLAALLIRSRKIVPWQQVIGHLLFIGVAVLLLRHQFPGFNNPLVVKQRLTSDAAPYAFFLNIDKPLIGFWILLTWPFIQLCWPNRRQYPGLLLNATLTILLCSFVALQLTMVSWAPKWPWFGWIWVINNLLLVSMAEEALFRGYLQEGLKRQLGTSYLGTLFAITGAALLFGIMHYAGGWHWVGVASLAGIGYGIAYHHSGWPAAVITHFTVNLLHFLCLTYPQLR